MLPQAASTATLVAAAATVHIRFDDSDLCILLPFGSWFESDRARPPQRDEPAD
jgi:hypothetical protein